MRSTSSGAQGSAVGSSDLPSRHAELASASRRNSGQQPQNPLVPYIWQAPRKLLPKKGSPAPRLCATTRCCSQPLFRGRISIRRFLLHVPPRDFHRIRHSGCSPTVTARPSSLCDDGCTGRPRPSPRPSRLPTTAAVSSNEPASRCVSARSAVSASCPFVADFRSAPYTARTIIRPLLPSPRKPTQPL